MILLISLQDILINYNISSDFFFRECPKDHILAQCNLNGYIYIYIIWKSTPLQRGQTLSG